MLEFDWACGQSCKEKAITIFALLRMMMMSFLTMIPGIIVDLVGEICGIL
jgi:hypothetical protein